jgi:hypothetical protein
MEKALQKAGATDFKLTIYPEAGHDSSTKAAETRTRQVNRESGERGA